MEFVMWLGAGEAILCVICRTNVCQHLLPARGNNPCKEGPAALFCLLSNMRNVQQSASDSRNSLSQMAVNRRLNLKFSLDVRNLLISHNVRKFRWSLGFKKNENGYKISSFIMNNVCTQLNWNAPARTAGGTSSSSSSLCGGLTSSSGIPRARQSTLPCQNGLKMLRTQCLHS